MVLGTDRIPLRVKGLFFGTLKINISLSMLQWTPWVISIGSTPEFKSKSNIVEALSEIGMDLRSSLQLHNRLVNPNPPLDNRTHKSSLNSVIHIKVLQYCVDHFIVKVSCIVLSYLSNTKIVPTWWRRATKKVYSTGSLDKSSSGHQRNLKVLTSFRLTITWWNIASMSEEGDSGFWRNLKGTPSRLDHWVVDHWVMSLCIGLCSQTLLAVSQTY